MIEVISHVPIGQDSALSAREIWRAVDCWAEHTVATSLTALVESGAVKRRKQPTIGIAFRWIYWREAA